MSNSVTAWTAACQAPQSFTGSWTLLRLMSSESVMLSKQLIICLPFALLPSIFPSIRVFSSELGLHIRWPKYWSFSFSISPTNEYSGFYFFRIDWFDLFAFQVIQESPPARHFKSVNSLEFSLLYGPTLTSLHDYWKNYSFDYMDLCWQSEVSVF